MDQPLLTKNPVSSETKGKKSLASNLSGSISDSRTQQKQKSSCCPCFFPSKEQDDHSDQDEGTTPDLNRNSNNKLSQHAASDFTSNHIQDQVFSSSSRPRSENDKEQLMAQNFQEQQNNIVQGSHFNGQLIGARNDTHITEEDRRKSNKSVQNVFASHAGDRKFSNESANYQGKSFSNSNLFPFQNQYHQIKKEHSQNSPTKTESGKDSMLDPSKSRKVKFNIRNYFQTQQQGSVQSPERLTHLFSTCINDEESFLLVKLKDRNFSGITANTSLNDNSLTNPNASNNLVDSIMMPPNMSNINGNGIQSKINFGGINKKSFRSDFNSSFLSIPEQICQSIAIRLKDQFVIDAFCGVGYNTCFFAKEASQIIGIDINSARIALAKHNIEFYKKKVELIQSDFFKLPRLKADVVVLHPDFTRGQDIITQPLSEERIDLITDVQPDLTESLQHAFNIAGSVVLILHKNCDITQLPLVLDKVNFATKKFTVEIELMNIDKKFSTAVVYLGEIADVKKTEEIEFYLKKLYDSTNFQSPSFEDKLRLLLIHIRERRRISGLAQLVLECEKQVTSPSNRKTLFQEFFDRLNEKKQTRVKSSSHLSSYTGEQDNFLEGDIANEDMPKQLLSEIQQIILNSGQSPRRQQQLGSIQKSPSSANLGDDAYMSSFSYNISNSHFHFHPSASHGYQNTSNILLNTNQPTVNNNTNNRLNSENQINSNHILDGIDYNNTNGQQQQQNHHMSALSKDRKVSNNQDNQNNLQQNNQYQEDENYGKDIDQHNQEDDDSEDEEQRKNVYYSCSYNSNALAASEASDSNSIRPQLSNNMYFNGNNNNNNAGYDRFNSQEDFDITPLGKDANKKMPEIINRQFSKARTSPGGIRPDDFGSPTADFFLKQDYYQNDHPELHDDQDYYDEDGGLYGDDDLNEKSKGIGKSSASKMTKNHNTFQNQNDFEEPIRSAKKKDIFTLPSSLVQ